MGDGVHETMYVKSNVTRGLPVLHIDKTHETSLICFKSKEFYFPFYSNIITSMSNHHMVLKIH